MIESGEVIALHGQNADVLFRRTSACDSCGACGLMSSDRQEVVVPLENTVNAQVGDRVEVQMTTGAVLEASLIAYIFPLVLMIIGIVAGRAAASALAVKTSYDVVGAVCGLVLCAVGFLVIRLFEPKLRTKKQFQIRITSILPEREDDGDKEDKDGTDR